MTRPRGFTLIEAIAVIAITGIIAAVVAIFIARPAQGYVDTVRRAQLSDVADTALRRMGRDIRTAVPNSVRVAGGNRYIEFVPTSDGGRYRIEGPGDPLDFNTTDSSFDILGALAATPNGYLVIFNTGQTSTSGCNGADVYEGCNRRSILPASTISSMSFTATANPLPYDSPAHRFQVVSSTGPMTYACEGTMGIDAAGNGTGTLRLYTNYGFNATQQTAFGAGTTSGLLANNVSACTFTYAPGLTARDGLVTLSLTLTRVNESVTLYHEVHVDNQP